MASKIPVLFLQSQANMGADSVIHSHVMRHLDRDAFSVHVACNAGDSGTKPESLSAIQKIPDVQIRPTRFAPGRFAKNGREALLAGAASALDFAGLARYVARERIRVIHSSDRRRDSTLAVMLSRLTRARSLVHVHVKWSAEYGAAARWAMRLADGAIGISRFVSDTIVAGGKPRAEVFTVLNSIEVPRWDPNIDGSGVLREFEIPAHTPVLVSVSRLFSWKGQRELLRALPLVKRTHPNVRLLIVGEDETAVHGGSFTAELRRLASDLDVSNNVTFTGARRDVAEIMAAASLFTMPSFEEPFGLVFLEAMAMRKPVVALNNGGTPEVVEHERTGLLSAPGDIATYASNVVRLLDDAELRARMGERGRARVVEHFGAERLAADMAAVYRTVTR